MCFIVQLCICYGHNKGYFTLLSFYLHSAVGCVWWKTGLAFSRPKQVFPRTVVNTGKNWEKPGKNWEKLGNTKNT